MAALQLPIWLLPSKPAYLALLVIVPLLAIASYRALSALGPWRRGVAVALRSIVLVLLICALAEFQSVRRSDDQTAVFVLDTSLSVPDDVQQQGFAFVRQAVETMRPGKDRVALITCAGEGRIEQIAYDTLRVQQFAPPAHAEQTNLSAGLRLARAIMPADTGRRIVVISDGNVNAGDTAAELKRLSADDIPVDVLPLVYNHPDEVTFERLYAPTRARADDRVELSMVLRATRATKGRVLLYHNGVPLDLDPDSENLEFPITLDKGLNRMVLPVQLNDQGVHRFQAVFTPDDRDDDTIFANNQARGFTIIGGSDHVLIVHEGRAADAASAKVLADALAEHDIACTVSPVDAVMLDPAELTAYSLVILSNVSAIALGEYQQAALAAYVHDLGGGLIVVGGDEAYGVGGYYRTPLEEVLPVVTDRRKLQLLSLSMVIVIDRSGSMSGDKIERAKLAARGAVDLLSPMDRIGVLAFAGDTEWVVPLMHCDNKDAIRSRLMRIGSGGGTDMYPALAQAGDALRQSDTNLRHVILLTDGQSMPGNFDRLSQELLGDGITVSAIGIGDDVDAALLTRIADLTGGRMYRTSDAAPLPQIFVRETMMAGRSGTYQGEFVPAMRVSAASPILRGIDPRELPPLYGYDITAGRPMASVPLLRSTDDGVDPVLAHWQVGLGRSVALTTGMWATWGRSWASWSGFSKFWNQAVRWTARPPDATDFDVNIALDGDRARVTLEAYDAIDLVRGGLRVQAVVVGPDHEPQAIDLTAVGLGRYEGSFPVSDSGSYIVRSAYAWHADGMDHNGSVQASVTVPYAAEYRDLHSDEPALSEIARATGGRVLHADLPESVYEPWSRRMVEIRRPIWDLLVRLAMACFLADVAVRRLAIAPSDVAEAGRRFFAGLVHAGAPQAAATTATLRKARAKSKSEERDSLQASPAHATTTEHLRKPKRPSAEPISLDDLSATQPTPKTPPTTAELPNQPKQPAQPQDQQDARARLLRAKRRAREELGGGKSDAQN